MAYSNFTLPDVIRQFGVRIGPTADLFAAVPPVAADPAFRQRLLDTASLATLINTEKSRSEMLIAPVVIEAWVKGRPGVSMFSGVDLVVDPAAGLSGLCDFLLGRGPQLPFVSAPVLVIVEAKNESIPGGMGQCAAEMVAVQRFNEREGVPVDPVYGVVTIGGNWRFLRLSGSELLVDAAEYLLPPDLDRVLGILLHVLGRNPLPA